MMLSLPFFSEPIPFGGERIPVLCMEHPSCLLRLLSALRNGEEEENQIIFSKNFEPFSFGKFGYLISDYFSYSLPTQLIKKLYARIDQFCQTDFAEEVLALQQTLVLFLEKLNEQLDDFYTFHDSFAVSEILKVQHFLPDFQGENEVETLLNYILLLFRLLPLRCCVLVHMHQYFTEEQLNPLFEDLVSRQIPVLLIEGSSSFQPSALEHKYVLDRDLCEIFDPEPDL